MCTALALKTRDCYFGRTLDIDRSYGEEVCILSRRAPIDFKMLGKMSQHFAIIGMGTVADGAPLFYDAANEHGLAMAGLNFPGNAYYFSPRRGCDNVAPFEFIPWILGQCKNLREARSLLDRINITDIPFSESLPNSPLHWLISDGEEAVVVESMKSGLHIYDNTAGVLTNNPPFPKQLEALKKYSTLRTDNIGVERREGLGYSDYCQGLGAVGLPGDLSSMSRFARAAFSRKNSVSDTDELSSVTQFFHLLSDVKMTRGLCKTDDGTFDITVYTSCINTVSGLYYYTTYDNMRISCVDMHRFDLDSDALFREPLLKKQSIEYQNR